MNILYHLVLAVTATALMPIIRVAVEYDNLAFLYALIGIAILVGLALWPKKYLGYDKWEPWNLCSLDQHDDYTVLFGSLHLILGALIPGTAFWLVYGILVVLTMTAQTWRYNPALMLTGYHIYAARTKSDKRIYLLSRQDYSRLGDVDVDKAFRISNKIWIK